MYTEDLQSHYKAVRQRIINAAPQPPKIPPVVTQRPAPCRDLPVLITPRHTMIEALKGILAQYGVTWEETFSYSRKMRYSMPKFHVWHEMEKIGWSYTQIAKFCRPTDPYNHTTVLHGVKRYRALVDK